MKKISAIVLSLLLALSACGTRTDDEKNSANEYAVVKTVADFKYGTALPYDKYTKPVEEGWTSWLSRTFTAAAPVYDYAPDATDGEISIKASAEWYDPETGDECNFYTIYPSSAAQTTGTVSATLLFYIPPLDEEGTEPYYGRYPAEYANYLDLSDYDCLEFTMSAKSVRGRDVSFAVYLKNYGSDEYVVYNYTGKGGKMTIEIDLAEIDTGKRDALEYIRLENRLAGMPKNDRVEVCWYKIKAGAYLPFNRKTSRIGGITVASEYLGNAFYTMCGAYSASGFYDEDDGLYKMWYGAGVPEQQSTDNVYYAYTSDPKKGWSKPVRITTDDRTGYKLVDPSGKLRGAGDPIGYGGDPSVIKVGGKYYMYFSGLEWDLDDGTYTHWNKVWLAVSDDAKTWNCVGAVVDAVNGGSLGYGSGAPSVVCKDGIFYLYYYSQAPSSEYPDEPIGLVMKTSEDGVHFGRAVCVNEMMSALDVKYIDEADKWIGTFYSEQGQFVAGASAGVRVAFSDDGVHWNFDFTDNALVAQDMSIPLNHNPGFIGDALGHAGTEMLLTYGANDLPLTFGGYWFSSAQYDSRQLELSRIKLEF